MDTNNTQLPQMITIKTAAKESNMTYHAVRQLCIEGKIKTIRIGTGKEKKKYLINKQSFYDFLTNTNFNEE